MMEKKCTKCGEVKSLEEFGRHAGSKDGKRARCKSCCNAQAREYRKSDAGMEARERYLATDKGAEYLTRNNTRKRVRYRANYCSDYYEKNKDQISKRHSKWRKSPSGIDSRKLAKARRRSRETGAPSDNWKASQIHSEANGRCLYCGTKVTLDEMHADHFIPLAKGGSNLRENIVCSCASCNLKKSDKMPEDFIGETL